MTEPKIEVYIGREALESIIVFNDEYPNLHNIFKYHAVINIDLTETELDEIFSDSESDLGTFCLKNNIVLKPIKGYFKDIREDFSKIQNMPRALFFFNISDQEALDISSKYGLIVQNENNINDDALSLHYYKRFEKGQTIEGIYDGWKNLLSGVKLLPFNSLVISDDHLLKNFIGDKNVGFENLKWFLNSILPKTLDGYFHLMIITPMINISNKKADRLNGELKAYLKTIRPYEFNVEFVFRDTLHARKAYSNYFVIICDKGFKMFNPVNKTSAYEDVNDIRIISILHDPLHTQADTMLEMSIFDLAKIKKLCNELTEQIKNGVTNFQKKIIGDTNKDKSIKNRLLN